MNHFKKNPVAMAVAASMAGMLTVGTVQAIEYEIWASDQSNSTTTATGLGTDGSYLWIWDSEDPDGAGPLNGIKSYAAGDATGVQPVPVACNNGLTPAPCDIHAIFLPALDEYENTTGGTAAAITPVVGATLGSTGGLARLHGAIPDPQNLYVNMNMFLVNDLGTGGLVGIMDGVSKAAIGLWRVSQTSAPSKGGRSLHMSFWNADGSALLLANLHGRILERIDITRDSEGAIVTADFNQAASLGMGGNSGAIVTMAKTYRGLNGIGESMIGTVSGAYDPAAISLTYTSTNNGLTCKQDSCGVAGAASVGRGVNVIVCPIVSSNNNVYITFGGGGLLIADSDATPMSLVGAYSNTSINAAGCGGVEVGGFVYLNAGTSAVSGVNKSTRSMFKLVTTGFSTAITEDSPAPVTFTDDFANTNGGGYSGNIFGATTNSSGQLPATAGAAAASSRSDAHGMTPTVSGRYVHMGDRIQNAMTVFNTETFGDSTYTLTGGGCAPLSVSDDPGLFGDDPAPDLMATGPNNKFLFVANRGPTPVSVSFNAQGSCPGVGIVTLAGHGETGTMTHVLRTSNTAVGSVGHTTGVDDIAPNIPAGGVAYTGAERSDPHGVALRIK